MTEGKKKTQSEESKQSSNLHLDDPLLKLSHRKLSYDWYMKDSNNRVGNMQDQMVKGNREMETLSVERIKTKYQKSKTR